jgi:hypothetical protein
VEKGEGGGESGEFALSFFLSLARSPSVIKDVKKEV